MKKTPKREMFTKMLAIADVQANAEMVEFINHEIELLDNKNAKKKTTSQQIET